MRSTIVSSVRFSGNGVHTGKIINVMLIPAENGSGIVFQRSDIKNGSISACYKNVKNTMLNTTISNESGASVSTIEHLMAAIYSYGISDITIELDGAEVPLMDGGSSDFCFLIEAAGYHTFDTKRKALKIVKEIHIDGENGSYIHAKPEENLRVECSIDFSSSVIGKQHFIFSDESGNFCNAISAAKTFGHENDVTTLRSQGICLGGDLYSAIIYNDEAIISPTYMYNDLDFSRHKALDFIGDLALCEYKILGSFHCFKPSHKLNNFFLHKLFSNTSLYKLI